MSAWLKKFPGYQVYEPGLELQVLEELPQFTIAGSLGIALPSLIARLLLPSKVELIIDIFVIGAEVFFLGLVLTLAITACILMFSRGSTYVADVYPRIGSDKSTK